MFFFNNSNKGPQIKEIVRILRPLMHRWFSFGVQLGIDLANLRMIESKQYRDPERNLIDLIDCWMNRAAKANHQSWTILAEAVEKLGDFQQLTLVLRSKAIQEGECLPSSAPEMVCIINVTFSSLLALVKNRFYYS